jgi:predicted helicase
LIPDAKHTWLAPAHGDEYGELLAIKSIFAIQSLGLNTNRDEVVFDFDRTRLVDRVQRFILDYNVEVDRHRHDATATFAEHIKWSSRLKECLQRGEYAVFEEAKIRPSVYRPFTKKEVYVDSILNQRTGRWAKISGPTIAVPGPGNRKPFGVLMSDMILPLDLAFEKVQCFPLAYLKDAAVAQFR